MHDEGLDEDTLVIFTSDNGPWLIRGLDGGSAGLLREGKGSTWEGGMRVPCIVRWTGHIAPGRVSADMASTLDLFPTILALLGESLPQGRVYDGHNQLPLLLGNGPGARLLMFYYRNGELYALRKGPWKIHLKTHPGYGKDKVEIHDPPLLFNLDRDPSERFNMAKDHPQVVADLLAEVERHKRDMTPGANQK